MSESLKLATKRPAWNPKIHSCLSALLKWLDSEAVV
jgi:hypothetical protein